MDHLGASYFKRKSLTISLVSTATLMALFNTHDVKAEDVACSSSTGPINIDTRSLPTTPGDTVLNGRRDGSSDTCIILGLNGATVDYPNGLKINIEGTSLAFRRVETLIHNGLTVDDAGNGSGLLTFGADFSTRITGNVNIINQAKLKFIPGNSASSSTRLHLDDAYFSIEAGSELQTEFDLGNRTATYISVGGIEGAGDLKLTNPSKRSSGSSSTIAIDNGDGKDYTYSGNISYENQSLPHISKRGSGTFTFLGEVNKAVGDILGFTNGFGLIEINDGAFQTTSDAFVFGTKVLLEGGDLILNQDTNGNLNGATFTGRSDIYKRGAGSIKLEAISSQFKGSLYVDEGEIALVGSASLFNADTININAGAHLDLSRSSRSAPLSRLSGSGTLALGGKSIRKIIRIAPGTNSVGVLNVTGSGDLDLGGTLLEVDLDPTQGTGNIPGVTHDQLKVQGAVTKSITPGIKLFDRQQGASISELLNGREFTVLSAGSGLSAITAASIIEDTTSFNAFIGADPETTKISDSEITVLFGIKTAQQVATTVSSAVIPTPAGGSSTGSSKNKHNATQQYLQKTLGLSGNQKPTEAQLNSHPVLQSMTTAQLARATSNNNPEAYSSNLTLSLEYAGLIANMVMDHASGAGIAMQALEDESVRNGRVWMNVAYVDGTVDGTRYETGDFEYDLTGIVIGTDLIDNEENTLGLFAGFGMADMNEHDNIDQDFDGDLFQAGLYYQYRFGDNYSINSMVGFLYGDYDTSRKNYDAQGGFGPKSKADFSSYGGILGVSLAKSFNVAKQTSVTPSMGVTYTHIVQDDIKESQGGVAYDYRIDDADADAVVLGVGADLTHSINFDQSVLVGDLRVRYEYDAYADNNSTHDIEAGLDGQSKATFVGQNRGVHGLILGMGLESKIGHSMTLGGGYVYTDRSDGHDSSVGANFTYYW